ncbi:MAG TPA: hypothetical protein ENG87_05965 [Candidatus Pacearchaeota archaeon]|nr:hypothetical protein [Candidatus Pacearchaeota archaeon]
MLPMNLENFILLGIAAATGLTTKIVWDWLLKRGVNGIKNEITNMKEKVKYFDEVNQREHLQLSSSIEDVKGKVDSINEHVIKIYRDMPKK